jgi:hypothetical protein
MFLPLLSRQALVVLHFLQTRSPDQVLVNASRHLRQCLTFFCGGNRSFSGFLLWTALDISNPLHHAPRGRLSASQLWVNRASRVNSVERDKILRREFAVPSGNQFVLDFLSIPKAVQSCPLDSRNMHESIFFSILGLYKPIPLGGVEPLYRSNSHFSLHDALPARQAPGKFYSALNSAGQPVVGKPPNCQGNRPASTLYRTLRGW